VNRQVVLVSALLVCISPLWAQTGPLRIRVVDPAPNVLPGAQITLLGPKDVPIRTLSTDKDGVLVWENLPLGNSRLRMNGFYPQEVRVTIQSADYEQKLEVILQQNITDYIQLRSPQTPVVAAFPLTVELDVLHRKVLSVLCPQFQLMNRGSSGDQGISQSDCMAGVKNAEIVPRARCNLDPNGHASHTGEHTVSRLSLSSPHAMPDFSERNRRVEERFVRIYYLHPSSNNIRFPLPQHLNQDVGIY
jgi:hypothetical protein